LRLKYTFLHDLEPKPPTQVEWSRT